jgi:hypothetical protein
MIFKRNKVFFKKRKHLRLDEIDMSIFRYVGHGVFCGISYKIIDEKNKNDIAMIPILETNPFKKLFKNFKDIKNMISQNKIFKPDKKYLNKLSDKIDNKNLFLTPAQIGDPFFYKAMHMLEKNKLI